MDFLAGKANGNNQKQQLLVALQAAAQVKMSKFILEMAKFSPIGKLLLPATKNSNFVSRCEKYYLNDLIVLLITLGLITTLANSNILQAP